MLAFTKCSCVVPFVHWLSFYFWFQMVFFFTKYRSIGIFCFPCFSEMYFEIIAPNQFENQPIGIFVLITFSQLLYFPVNPSLNKLFANQTESLNCNLFQPNHFQSFSCKPLVFGVPKIVFDSFFLIFSTFKRKCGFFGCLNSKFRSNPKSSKVGILFFN